MRVKYYAEDGTAHEIDAPEGTTLQLRSHETNELGEELADILIVPWRGTRIGLEGDVAWRAAADGILGLRLVRSGTSDATSGQALWQ